MSRPRTLFDDLEPPAAAAPRPEAAPAADTPLAERLRPADLDEVVGQDDVVGLRGFLRRAIAEGRQAYWVCPLVEESEAVDMTAAEERFKRLRAALGTRVAIHRRGKGGEVRVAFLDEDELDRLFGLLVRIGQGRRA